MDEIRALKEIKKYHNGRFEMLTDLVVREISFTINVNDFRLVAIACLPENLPALALGFLFSEGLLMNQREILDSEYTPAENLINFKLDIPEERIQSFFLTGEKTSGCGSTLSSALSGNKRAFSELKIEAESILQLMRKFQQDSALFKQTGGVHSAGLVKHDEIAYYAEDIGRHNAVDKVAGMALMSQCDLTSYYLICSGRISSEIVKKCVRLGIPLIVSQSAVTSEAIRLGWEYKTFLMGFTRGGRFNLYTGIEEEIFVKNEY
ncbi:MAG: formate dehydrogenase accessory sulfurtransferase FdhD [Candidatus Stygibacter frigidus]|nr:formate dehydrogenase accessory sulfurtransferase FdhD [Candidatus Stygibacter frigidus]